MPDFFKYIPDKQFLIDSWNNAKELPHTWTELKNYGQGIPQTLQEYTDIYQQAAEISDLAYGDTSETSNSRKNAYRHSLGIGMLQDKLAKSPLIPEVVAEAAAKGAGYLWELADLPKYINDPSHRTDTRHDLTANAAGAYQARNTKSQAELERVLKQMADESRIEQPRAIYERYPGYMTRSVK